MGHQPRKRHFRTLLEETNKMVPDTTFAVDQAGSAAAGDRTTVERASPSNKPATRKSIHDHAARTIVIYLALRQLQLRPCSTL